MQLYSDLEQDQMCANTFVSCMNTQSDNTRERVRTKKSKMAESCRMESSIKS